MARVWSVPSNPPPPPPLPRCPRMGRVRHKAGGAVLGAVFVAVFVCGATSGPPEEEERGLGGVMAGKSLRAWLPLSHMSLCRVSPTAAAFTEART
jgi:hypothetical protein